MVQEDGPLVGELQDLGVDCEVVETGSDAAAVLTASARLRTILKRVSPDVVVGNGIKSSLVVLASSVPLGIPMCWVRHDTRFSESLGQVIARLADAVVFVAPPSPIEQKRFHPIYLPPPVTAEPIDPDAARSSLLDLGVPDDRLWLGMFTRLVPQKGVDVAIQALAHAPEWRLVVAGTPDRAEPGEDRRLQALAEQAAVSDRVTWLGHVEAAGQLAGAFDAIAVLTRPGGKGYPQTEGYPLSLIEACAAGVPVIADPRRVPPMSLPEVAAGSLAVDADDPADVARALNELADEATRGVRGDASAAVGASHPRPADTAGALVDLLAGLAFRPDAGLRGGPRIAVVSTVKNEGRHAEDLVRRLLSMAADHDEVVIVDGGSDDDTLDRLQAVASLDDRLQVLSRPGCGISEGRNIGISAATAPWIACTDAGCVPDEQWLSSLRGAAASGTGDLVTGTYRASYGHGRAWEIALAHVAYPDPGELRRRTPLVKAYAKAFGRAYDATLPTGRSVAFTREVWLAAGGFPEDLPTAEDVVFGRNAVGAGARAVLCADACVEWDQRPTLRSNAKMFFGYGHGDGLSGDRRLIGRDLLRAAVYALGPAMLMSGRTRPLAVAGAAAYLSLPVVRSVRGPRPVAATSMVPVVAAVRDVAKAAGCLAGLRERRVSA